MALEPEVIGFLEIIKEITSVSVDSLLERSEWGSINFNDAQMDINRFYSLCNHFKVLPLEQLPSDVVTQLKAEIEPARQTLLNIHNFTLTQSNPTGVQAQYVATIKQQVDTFYKTAHVYVPYLAYQKGEIQKNIKELTSSVDAAKSLLNKSQSDTESKSSEIDKIIQAAREASASVGVAHFTADFVAESTAMEKQANVWLIATIFLAIVSFGFAIFFLVNKPDVSTVAMAIQYISSKILILILLITGTLWCGNLYKAAKHQAAANRFKGNSLKTFQAFVNATDDNAIKDAVLVETTRAIFSESATGYINSDNSSADKSTKIVEVIKHGAQAASAVAKVNK